MAEGRLGKAGKYLTHDLLGHTVGARGFVEGGLAQARRTKGKGIETRAIRAALGSFAGWGADVLAPATYKAVTYEQGLRRIISLPPAFALDVAANVATVVAAGATLHFAPVTIVPIKGGVNAAENAILDAVGAAGEKVLGIRR